MATKRVWLTSEESKVDAMLEMAERYGMPVSNYVGMCAWMGHKMMIRTLEPENYFTPEQMVQMYLAAKSQGMVVDDLEEDQIRRMVGNAENK